MNSSDGICVAVFIIETHYFDTGGGKRFARRTGPGCYYDNGFAGLLIPSGTPYDPRFDESSGAMT
ncbi:MAG: hypothetical protein ACN6PY_11195, partial [Paraburkholderia nemoris]